MSTTEEQLGLTTGSDKQSSKAFSFTEEDNNKALERLFSGENGEEASKIVYQIMFGEYESEREKEHLLARFKQLAKEASRKHLEEREDN